MNLTSRFRLWFPKVAEQTKAGGVAVPSMLRPAVRAVGRFLARRFRSAYVRLSRVDVEADSLQWYEVSSACEC